MTKMISNLEEALIYKLVLGGDMYARGVKDGLDYASWQAQIYNCSKVRSKLWPLRRALAERCDKIPPLQIKIKH